MRDLTTLLRQQAYEGYPTEYLLARVRGRRGRLVTARTGGGGGVAEGTINLAGRTEPEARALLHAELRWMYRQMNGDLRRTFAPLFLWFELRTIILSLRFRRRGERERAFRLLAASLLGEEVRRVLAGEGEPAAVIDALAPLLATVGEPCRELGTLFRKRGGREWEERLATIYLEEMAGARLHPVLAEFFRGVIDLRNLGVLAKEIRWGGRDPQAFASGGELSPERLLKAREEGTPAALALLIGSLRGMAPLGEAPANPEPLLLSWLTRKVRRLAREPSGMGLILDYLWRHFIEVRNLGIVFHGAALERPALHGELIG